MKKMNLKNSHLQGFSLIEVLISLGLIAITFVAAQTVLLQAQVLLQDRSLRLSTNHSIEDLNELTLAEKLTSNSTVPSVFNIARNQSTNCSNQFGSFSDKLSILKWCKHLDTPDSYLGTNMSGHQIAIKRLYQRVDGETKYFVLNEIKVRRPGSQGYEIRRFVVPMSGD
ncbi:MAG: prepilin-type N-terminal cleavage/methylation domain-containing protein [SAR116 cluster bacterium]|nr:hypothetical protein [Paracoccaceae bacterium]RCL81193.1 MAG: prepilin-type N-terminal cleavage/methylation domain-containing protein [SAR116 cluster bacterium]RPH14310.1 MAG: prepilin-type N-terminal cleavage/methylation domain-containing protein [Alphaproteobacteria bacterium TMED150]|tara:strand:+ start:6896 stop:7402 length:507 start_codon:yes stop_codon:yes gene_type:complete